LQWDERTSWPPAKVQIEQENDPDGARCDEQQQKLPQHEGRDAGRRSGAQCQYNWLKNVWRPGLDGHFFATYHACPRAFRNSPSDAADDKSNLIAA